MEFDRRLITSIISALLISLFVCSCSSSETENTEFSTEITYISISMEDAKKILDEKEGYVIVDVRRQDEYDEGHIPGAILIPNESIGEDEIEELPDKDQLILVYCRSGRRSKEASQKLYDMGYKNVFEFGGIVDWTGEVVKE